MVNQPSEPSTLTSSIDTIQKTVLMLDGRMAIWIWQADDNSPLLFSLVLEVVHKATIVDVQAVLSFPLLCLALIHKVATIFKDKIVLLKCSGSHHSATFLWETLNLQATVITGC